MGATEEDPITSEENERRDEAALRRGSLSVRAATLSDRSLSIGVGVHPGTAWVEHARSRGIPIVHRSTGGTGVLHVPGDLVWSVILPRNDPRVGRDYSRAYARFGAGANRFLAELGIESAWTAAPARSTSCCTLGARGCVLSVGERILGGAAQHLTRDALLHHGTISVDVDRTLLRALFDLSSPSDADLLAGIRDLDRSMPSPHLAAKLERALQATFG